MDRIKKLLMTLTTVLIVLSLIFSSSYDGIADFGDYSGDDDYGYDDYDDYDYDDYDYDYDDDDDYYYGGGGSSGGGSGGSYSEDSPWISIGSLIVLIILMWPIIRRILGASRSEGVSGRPSRPNQNRPRGAEATTGLRPVDAIREWDPNFSAEEIKQRLSKLYVQMQNCWTAKDLTPLRGDFTDAQFAQYDRQLQRYRDERQTNVVERIAVLDVTPKGVKQDGANDILVAEISARITSYTVDDRTGRVVQGNKNEEKFMRYEWTLIRPKGATTVRQSKDSAFNCPNCGAPLDINNSARCPYCGSIVTKADYDWVISGIKGLSQRTS